MEPLAARVALLIPLLLCSLVMEARVISAHTYVVQTVATADSQFTSSSAAAPVEEGLVDRYEELVRSALTQTTTTSEFSPPPGTGQAQDGTIIYRYEHVMPGGGFAVTLTAEQAATMASLPGVVSVSKQSLLQLQTTHTPHVLGLSAVTGLWPESDYGKDTIIGVIDGGIEPEHPSFADSGLGPIPARWKGACVGGQAWTAKNCNKKIIGARYFFAGYESEVGKINANLEYKSARDDSGHGTHVAGTAAGRAVQNVSFLGTFARGVAQGMAPKARLAVYKTCWLEGCGYADILAAIDAAIADGVDIISFSVGGYGIFQYFEDPIAIGMYGANKRGIFVSAAGGNAGPNPATLGNYAPWITTVGAARVGREFPLNVRLGDGKVLPGSSFYVPPRGSRKKFLSSFAGVVFGSAEAARNATSDAAFCLAGSLDAAMVSGKVVVCTRGGGITATTKSMAVRKAGGVGMIFVNPPSLGNELFSYVYELPATMIGYGDGVLLKAYIASTANPIARLVLPAQRTVVGSKPAPSIATFSSRGPNVVTPQLLKPDLVAPGVGILAAWPQKFPPARQDVDRVGPYNVISGTSMACPHISGLGALLKAKHPKWSPAAIRSALMTTATIHDNTNSTITDGFTRKAATPYDFGAGFVRPEKAAHPGLIYDLSETDYFHFLCALGLAANETRVLDSRPCPSTSPTKLENFNYPSFSAVFKPKSSSEITTIYLKRTVTNVGWARATYKASFANVPSGYGLSVWPSTLAFTKKNQKKSFTLTVKIPAGPLPVAGKFVTKFAFLTWRNAKYGIDVRSPIAMSKQL